MLWLFVRESEATVNWRFLFAVPTFFSIFASQYKIAWKRI